MHIPNKDIYFPAVVLAIKRLATWSAIELCPPTRKSNYITEDSESITEGDVEVLFSGAV